MTSHQGLPLRSIRILMKVLEIRKILKDLRSQAALGKRDTDTEHSRRGLGTWAQTMAIFPKETLGSRFSSLGLYPTWRNKGWTLEVLCGWCRVGWSMVGARLPGLKSWLHQD